MTTMEAIQVYVRVRPLLPNEGDGDGRNAKSVIKCSSLKDNDGKPPSISIESASNSKQNLRCAYDNVFSQSTSNADMYQESDISSCVDAFVSGYNTTIFAYGQTGSGKTFTMFGKNQDSYDVSQSSYGGPNHAILHENAGIIPRAVVEIFKKVSSGEKESAKIKKHMNRLMMTKKQPKKAKLRAFCGCFFLSAGYSSFKINSFLSHHRFLFVHFFYFYFSTSSSLGSDIQEISWSKESQHIRLLRSNIQ
jgi:hypothetical protein